MKIKKRLNTQNQFSCLMDASHFKLTFKPTRLWIPKKMLFFFSF